MENYFRIWLQPILLFTFSFCFLIGFSQTEQQKKQITKSYDFKKIAALKTQFINDTKSEKAKAYEAAKKNGWEIIKKNSDGSFDELMFLSPEGKPVYYSIQNSNAAKSTRAIHLNTGGSLGLNLDGQGMNCAVWDGGPSRATHEEFEGRITIGDGNSVLNNNSFHGTHVTGTIGATGFDLSAKGMAPLSSIKTFDWNNDLAEALTEAENGLLLSNHSYGIPIANAPGNWYMGAYSGPARVWDQLSYATPYYLMVASAGNDGNVTNPSPTTSGYDKLNGNKTAKNNLVVANAQDANIDNAGNLINVNINSSSSEGPTDDRRIKPDITGNGTGLFSTLDGSDSDYDTLSGTSMSSPNVMGTLLLLQQHYNNTNLRFMRAATLKGLACHTADDRGRVGPDAIWGWGLLNAKKAAQTITSNGLQSWISEETLNQGESFTFMAQSDGVNPLLASICWTDIPGQANTGSLNNATPVLVNDLDIRITKDGTTYFPWKLQNAANLVAIQSEDNAVDNIEQINIINPSGNYIVTVTHKGVLQDGPQKFGFVVTGLSSEFSLTSLSNDQTACIEGSATYDFNFTSSNSSTTNFTAIGLPIGAVAVFSNNSMNTSGTFTLTISNLQNAIPGIYEVGIVGNNGAETETRFVNLKVSSTDFETILQNIPANGQIDVSTALQLNWDALENADSYQIQVATDNAFTNIVSNGTSSNTNYNLGNLNENTIYFWRVFPVNQCGDGTVANIFSFQTGQLICNNIFEPTDYANAFINGNGPGLASLYIPVTGGIRIGDLNINLNISHTKIQDLTVVLEGPASLNFPRTILFNEPCGENENIDCVLDESGTALFCNSTIPSISGFVLPYESLSYLNNLIADGTWVVYVTDPYTGDGGIINHVSLDFCAVAPTLSLLEKNQSVFMVYPNPSTGLVYIKFNENLSSSVNYALFDLQGRIIQSKQITSNNELINMENLQNGVYLLNIENGSQKTIKKIVLNRQ